MRITPVTRRAGWMLTSRACYTIKVTDSGTPTTQTATTATISGTIATLAGWILIALGAILFLLPLANWQVNLRGRGAAMAGA